MVVLLQRRQARLLAAPHLILLLLSALCSGHDLACPRLVCGVVEQRPNVVHKEGIQQLRDLLLVGKVQSALEWNPEAKVSSSTVSQSQEI